MILKLKFFPLFQKNLIKVYNNLNKKKQIPNISYHNMLRQISLGKNKIIRDKNNYSFAKNIVEYSIKKDARIEIIYKNLDQKSKDVLRRSFDAMNYIYTHGILDLRKMINKEDLKKSLEITKFINKYKKEVILPINHYEISCAFYHNGLKCLPTEVIDNLKNTDFIDGGAFIGDSSVVYEKYYEPKKIYAFEPAYTNFNMIQKTIELNKLKKVIPVRFGLGEKKDIIRMKHFGTGSSISDYGDQDIHITTIDDYVFEHDLHVGFIKLDTEGFESKILKGAKETITTFKPVLSIAIYHTGEDFFNTMYFIKKLNPNYKCLVRKLFPLSPYSETVLLVWNRKPD